MAVIARPFVRRFPLTTQTKEVGDRVESDTFGNAGGKIGTSVDADSYVGAIVWLG